MKIKEIFNKVESLNEINKELGINKEYIVKASLGFCCEMKKYQKYENLVEAMDDYYIKNYFEKLINNEYKLEDMQIGFDDDFCLEIIEENI